MIEIDRATPADLDAIEDIERHSFPAPWPRATFAAELARQHSRIIVARSPGVIGYCNFWIVADEVHVHAIAIHPDHRRAGLGGRLVAYALDEGRRVNCAIATLEVRRSNRPAIAMYERAGFGTVHVRARYYQDNDEDALVMACTL